MDESEDSNDRDNEESPTANRTIMSNVGRAEKKGKGDGDKMAGDRT